MKIIPFLLGALFASPAFAGSYQIRIPAAIDPQVAASLETPGQAKLSLSPGTYDFGDVPIEQSGRYTFNLSNVGDKAAYLSFSSLAAPFSLTHDCPAWLSASGACSFAVEFAPGATGQVSASLTINGGIGAQHAGLSLSGTGLPRAPDPAALSASPGVLEFEPTFTTLTRTATLTLTNAGESTAQLQLPFGASGPFSVASTTCAVTLAPGASCQVSYRFAPQSAGPIEATVMLQAADPATPAALTLRGEGRLPGALALSAPSLDFGSVLMTTEASRSVTLTNTGAAPVALPASFVVSAPFGLIAEECPESLEAGASCTISLKYAPTQAGVQTQNLSISSTPEVIPVTLAMTGTGQAPGVLSPSVSTLDFGNVKIGATKDLALVLTNSGATALALPETFTLEAPYTLQSENCTTSLAPATSCTLNIRFAPTVEGSLAKTLSIPGSTAVPAVNVALTGVGQKLGIVTSGAARTWEDGTLAASCSAYRTPTGKYAYAGVTGDGVYRIDVDGAGALTPFNAFCDMTTDGGGWTVIQTRNNGSVDFFRTYTEYANGFGAGSEYWLGNNRIAVLTASPKALRVEMTRTNGQAAYANYDSFKINGASDKYRLSVSGYSGTAGDSLGSHFGAPFSTKDVDNDNSTASCAVTYSGAWWYKACHSSNLNGLYLNGPHTSYANGVNWYTFSGHYESLKTVYMKVR